MKVVLNNSPFGFDVSDKVFDYLIEECNWKSVIIPENDEDFEEVDAEIFRLGDEYDFVQTDLYDISFRVNPDLVQAVEACGVESYTEAGSRPVVVDIPGLEYCDGLLIISVPYGREYVIKEKDLMG